MPDATLLSFEMEEGHTELRIVFNSAGALHLIDKLQRTLLNGDHLHDMVGPITVPGALTRKRTFLHDERSKITDVQYKLLGDNDEWFG